MRSAHGSQNEYDRFWQRSVEILDPRSEKMFVVQEMKFWLDWNHWSRSSINSTWLKRWQNGRHSLWVVSSISRWRCCFLRQAARRTRFRSSGFPSAFGMKTVNGACESCARRRAVAEMSRGSCFVCSGRSRKLARCCWDLAWKACADADRWAKRRLPTVWTRSRIHVCNMVTRKTKPKKSHTSSLKAPKSDLVLFDEQVCARPRVACSERGSKSIGGRLFVLQAKSSSCSCVPRSDWPTDSGADQKRNGMTTFSKRGWLLQGNCLNIKDCVAKKTQIHSFCPLLTFNDLCNQLKRLFKVGAIIESKRHTKMSRKSFPTTKEISCKKFDSNRL